MHLVFIESVPWPYRIDAPFHRPIGGTQSAASYLIMTLAALGMRVSFINGEAPHETHGVRALSTNFNAGAISDADALIRITAPDRESVEQLREWAPHAKRMVWLHHAPDQPSVQCLSDPETIAAWDAFIFVSQWQEQAYLKQFPLLATARRTVLRNAISPAFENLFEGLSILSCKSSAPRLAYASTPFRGLDRLLYGWHDVLSAHPSAELQVFSSMKLYNDPDTSDLQKLLDTARLLPGVTHVGPVPQPDLASALRSSLILAYPNTFAETACIAVMEAMAAGCLVITSNLGALPETLGGHGILLDLDHDAVNHAQRFAKEIIRQIHQLKSDWQTGALENRLAAQVQWANDNYTWRTRATEWVDFLRSI